MKMDNVAFRRVIRMHLAVNDMTARDFAKTIGVSASYISAVMTGKKPPSEAVLQALGYRRVVRVEYERVKKCL